MIVVDNTSPSSEIRNEYRILAAKYGMKVTYIHVNIPEDMSKYLNKLRSYLGGKRVPDISYSMYNKKFNPVILGLDETIISIDKLPIDLNIMTNDI
jgi:bifunctional polynucleotide phosphatase/kinase